MNTNNSKLRVACYGTNGHQVIAKVINNPKARLVAVSEIPTERIKSVCGENRARNVRIESDLDALVKSDDVDLISLCSPRRDEQCEQALRCLEAGKHVLAEKPAALSVEELQLLRDTAKQCHAEFRQMGECGQEATLSAIADLVDDGRLGDVVQVYAQKSYPYHDGRPQDTGVDGGLIRQAGIHAIRFVQRATGLRAVRVSARDTQRGNPGEGDLQMAASLWMKLQGGATASIVLNYLNPSGIGYWGNDQIRVFGTEGMVEAVNGFNQKRMILGDASPEPIPGVPDVYPAFFDSYVDLLLDDQQMPYSYEDDLFALRTVIRAQKSADKRAIIQV